MACEDLSKSFAKVFMATEHLRYAPKIAKDDIVVGLRLLNKEKEVWKDIIPNYEKYVDAAFTAYNEKSLHRVAVDAYSIEEALLSDGLLALMNCVCSKKD